MKIGQYCQRQRCKHVELEQFWHAFASRWFVSDSRAFLFTFHDGISLQDKSTVGVISHLLAEASGIKHASIIGL